MKALTGGRNAITPGRTQVLPLTEGALLAAVAVVLALAGFYLPVIGPLIAFLWPVPVALIHIRHGLRISVLTVVAAGLVLTAFVGPIQALLMASSFGLVGLGFGIALQRRASAVWTLLAGSAGLLLSFGVSLGISFLVFKVNPLEVGEELRQAVTGATALYRRIGVPEASIQQVEAMFEQAIEAFRYIFPAAMAVAALINGLLNFSVLRAVLRRLGYQVPDLPAFATWRLPQAALIPLLAGLVAVATKPYHGREWLALAGTNVWTFMNLILMVQGISVGYFYLSRWNVSRPARIGILAFAAFQPVVQTVATMVGLVDLFIDLRHLEA